MEDLVPVGERDGAADIQADLQGPIGWEGALAANVAIQALALDVFQHHEEDPVLPLHRDEFDDVGMLQARHDAGLLQQVHDFVLLLMRDFERHLAVHPGIERQVHGPETSRTEAIQDLVFAQGLVLGKHVEWAPQ